MNRHQRRAAKAQGISKTLDPVVAIHEAGHAVARVLSATDFGRTAEEMISHIDVATGESLGESFFDKSVTLKSQAVTGAVGEVVGIGRGAFSGNMRVSFQAARSIG